MLLNLDKFFIQELQAAGYDIDYKKAVEIYRKSRENPAYIRRRQRRLREEAMLEKAWAAMKAAESDHAD